MLPNRSCHVFLGTIITLMVLPFSYSATVTKGLYPSLSGQNAARAGVCTLEVPTIDLLSAADKASGIRPHDNGTRPGYSKIEICCSGWTRKPHSKFDCEPICDNGCTNGNCTAPNVCTCKRGYIQHLSSCVPTCPVGCLNGLCTRTGSCSCNAGFELSRDGAVCLPVCTGGCGVGGECVGAEACKCKTGFSLNRRTNKCEHHCEGGCGAGTCIGPNQCSCQPGFKQVQNACIPDCPRGCTNGKCTAPNVCTCDPGWTIDKTGSSCQPHCREPCLNADCTAPDVCTCKKGYAADPGSSQKNRCVAFCPGGCPNGMCAAPSFCICNPGFMKEAKGSNHCVRRFKREASIHWELIPRSMNQ